MCAQFAVAARRVCRLLQLHSSTFHYQVHTKDQTALRIRLRDLAAARPWFGYRRLHVLLLREGWMVNYKQVYRLYHDEGLQWRTR